MEDEHELENQYKVVRCEMCEDKILTAKGRTICSTACHLRLLSRRLDDVIHEMQQLKLEIIGEL